MERITKTFLARAGQQFRKYRNRLTAKLHDESLKRVRLYDLRHYFGTMTYAKTKDIPHVKKMMGRSKLETTMVYTELTPLPRDEEFICRIARTVKEANELIEADFEYTTDVDSNKMFRKPAP